ncbi:hypothetical protein [Variovorax sp. RA8]|uniref:hypothetical protein n=1 Tax=Variovorax sp. (strain JCM 16519 / RA8) TaxID=662548 RepID=UPI000AF6CE46|nr:hypothetical protein [Variovorax sp. RA8]VTU44981.1 hypothetical protein RA8P2_00417 [Variovorax sp. RA8]
MTTSFPIRSSTRARETNKAPSKWLAPVCTAAVVLVAAAGAVVYLANQRGEEIARGRVERAEQIAVGKLVQAFVSSKSVLVMKDGSRRELLGVTATLLSTKPVAGERLTWLALGRAADGTYFGQRFRASAQGEVWPVTDAQEVAAEFALGELRAQIAASGADVKAARAFMQAATTGAEASVRR